MRYTKLVPRLELHGPPIDFRELCLRALPSDTQYLVLDLDRTVHLERNFGELLGWELSAATGYGSARLDARERSANRICVDLARPLGMLRYTLVAGRTWALPGLSYLFWGRIAPRTRLTRALSERRFGGAPLRGAQRGPQLTLMRQLATLPEGVARVHAERVWDRCAPDQVMTRADLDWLRRRCPQLQIIIASASPREAVEVAAERLGADGATWSTLDHVNSGPAKIRHLFERYPEMREARTVGITDTHRGEDHCWSEHFQTVVDVNSDAPYAPILRAESPTRAIHSAQLLTRRELADPSFRDPRRRPAEQALQLDAATMAPALAVHRRHVEALIEGGASAARVQRALASARRQLPRSAPPVPAALPQTR